MMRTTNPNESFNVQAWRRTSKDLLVTKNTVSTAVLEYTKGTNESLLCSTCWISEMDITLYYMQHHPPGSNVWMHHDMLMKSHRRRD